VIAEGVHVDNHDMGIAPNDPERMIVGEVGGDAIALNVYPPSFDSESSSEMP